MEGKKPPTLGNLLKDRSLQLLTLLCPRWRPAAACSHFVIGDTLILNNDALPWGDLTLRPVVWGLLGCIGDVVILWGSQAALSPFGTEVGGALLSAVGRGGVGQCLEVT